MNNCALSFTCTNLSVSEQDSVSRLRINETTSNLSISRVEPISVITHADRLGNNGGTVNELQLSRKGMNIGFLNVQGLCSRDMTKFSEIELMMTSERNKTLSILSLCETKLKDNKLTSVFHVNGFHSPFRKDNHTNAGGGILVYVRNNIIAKRRFDLETNDIACLWLEIIPEKGKSFLVGSLYRNPTERVEWVDRFENFMDTVLKERKETIQGVPEKMKPIFNSLYL